MIINGIEFLDEDLELFDNGDVHDATLAHDEIIQGIPCAGGKSVVFDQQGRLKFAWLSQPIEIGRIYCQPGILYLHDNGLVANAALGRNHQIAGKGVSAGERVTLSDNGSLLEYSQTLEHDDIIGGIPCAAKFRVWCYPDGRVSSAVITSPLTIAGKNYPRGTELYFSRSGQVTRHYDADLDSSTQYKQRVFGSIEFPSW